MSDLSSPGNRFFEMAAIASAASAVSLSFAPKPTSSAVAFSSSSSLFFSSNPGGLKRSLGLRSGNVRSNGRKRLYCNCLFGLGVPEMVVIAGVAALIFGPKQLPEIGRSIGKTVKSFQQVYFFSIFPLLFMCLRF